MGSLGAPTSAISPSTGRALAAERSYLGAVRFPRRAQAPLASTARASSALSSDVVTELPEGAVVRTCELAKTADGTARARIYARPRPRDAIALHAWRRVTKGFQNFG